MINTIFNKGGLYQSRKLYKEKRREETRLVNWELNKNLEVSQVWWIISVIPAFMRFWQKHQYKCEVNPNCTVKRCEVSIATQCDPGESVQVAKQISVWRYIAVTSAWERDANQHGGSKMVSTERWDIEPYDKTYIKRHGLI